MAYVEPDYRYSDAGSPVPSPAPLNRRQSVSPATLMAGHGPAPIGRISSEVLPTELEIRHMVDAVFARVESFGEVVRPQIKEAAIDYIRKLHAEDPPHFRPTRQQLDKTYQDLRAIFDMYRAYDKNGNGCMDPGELLHALVSLDFRISDDTCRDALQRYDSRKCGALQAQEFAVLWLELRVMRRRFQTHAQNGVAKLTWDGFAGVIYGRALH
eukprot:CAMPEP_0204391452 /NCGR_PEP_ID=MMETSP0469-20131031/61255_1 /ASSEMBLY_ACC=CAM_ASM_000384 /TAXON_ID=2969 /ORGANISM="Oxyrrhis marina" /LENGTH=211 /DNA_ID=CAMNT_0051385407 /DNA_START=24 /DNA_END=659 /DNA_ORIENTATION=+